jgi:hypothetical protein
LPPHLARIDLSARTVSYHAVVTRSPCLVMAENLPCEGVASVERALADIAADHCIWAQPSMQGRTRAWPCGPEACPRHLLPVARSARAAHDRHRMEGPMTEQSARSEHDSIPEIALAWHRDGRGSVLATVIETWGSAPRQAGSQLAISGAGEIMGSVSGGCVEGAVVTEAMEALADRKSRVMTFGVSDETAFAVGLACGGTIRVLVEPVGDGAEALPEAVLEGTGCGAGGAAGGGRGGADRGTGRAR